jgi:hypothetical protein
LSNKSNDLASRGQNDFRVADPDRGIIAAVFPGANFWHNTSPAVAMIILIENELKYFFLLSNQKLLALLTMKLKQA